MREPAPIYNGRIATRRKEHQPAPLPPKAHKLALRLLQLAKEPGEYPFVLSVDKNGRWQVKLPLTVEELGE